MKKYKKKTLRDTVGSSTSGASIGPTRLLLCASGDVGTQYRGYRTIYPPPYNFNGIAKT